MIFKFSNKSKILIISPHPDDEVIGCGGVIAKAKANKSKLNVLYVTTGSTRQFVTKNTDHSTRIKEIEKVSSYGAFKYSILFKDKFFVKLDTVPQKVLIDLFEDHIQKIKPDIIFIPFSKSYNQDHRAVYTAAITALRPLPTNIRHHVNYIIEYEEPYTWSIDSIFSPNLYLNTSDFEKDKIKLMKLHKSQDRKFPFARSSENLIYRMRIRGSEIGVKSAEAFKLIRGQFD